MNLSLDLSKDGHYFSYQFPVNPHYIAYDVYKCLTSNLVVLIYCNLYYFKAGKHFLFMSNFKSLALSQSCHAMDKK